MADDLEVARLRRERDELRTKLERLQGLYDATTGGTEFHEVPGTNQVVLHARVPARIVRLAKGAAAEAGLGLSEYVTKAIALKIVLQAASLPGREVLEKAADDALRDDER